MPALTLLLTVWCVLVHGYHPYGEDGGVYLAGIQWLLDPSLYKQWNGFVTAHLRLSLFPLAVAALVHTTHLPLLYLVFALYVASLWMTLVAGWQLAQRCFRSTSERCGAVLLLAAWLTMPVAGTSLILVDPYLTARSFSTPLGLFALVGMLDFLNAGNAPKVRRRSLLFCVVVLAISTAIHPLMSLYTLLCLALLLSLSAEHGRRVQWTGATVLAAITTSALLRLLSPAASAAYLQVAHSRTYWFPDQWRWFELIGLVAPLLLCGWMAREWRRRADGMVLLLRSAVIAGSCCAVIAALFARTSSPSVLVASLQPLRQLQLVYLLMILSLGALLDRWLGRLRRGAWPVLMVLFGCVMFLVQRETYPDSSHVEAPWRLPANGWEQAFVWISRSTERDAVFAIAPDYTSRNGEDAQNFAAIAQRSNLPDYSKDGGVASITPGLAAEWMEAQQRGTGIDRMSDAERLARLRGTPAGWIVLPAASVTALPCPYRNAATSVCRLR